MTDIDLAALADRVEALTGACHSMDLEIARIRGVTIMMRNGEDTANYETTHWRYTASIDAALTLVPAGLRMMLSEWDDEPHLRLKGPWQAVLSKPGSDASFDAMKGYRCDHAATPALALTAAALRARLQSGSEAHG